MASIDIEVGLDERGMAEGLAKAHKAIADFQKQTEKVGSKPLFDKISNDPAIAKIQVNMTKLAEKIHETNAALESEISTLKILEEGYKKALAAGDAETVKDLTAALQQQRDVVDDLQTKNAGYAASLGGMYRQLETAQGGFNKMGGAARVLRTITMALPAEMRGVTSAFVQTGQAAAQGAKIAGIWGAAIAIAAQLAAVAVGKYIEKRKEARKAEEEFRAAAASNAGAQIALYEKLRLEYNKLADSRSVKEWIKENQESFTELGVAIDTTSEAESVFVNNSEAFIRSLQERAKAAAYTSAASKIYEQYVDDIIAAEQKLNKKANVWDFLETNKTPASAELREQAINELKAQYEKDGKEWNEALLSVSQFDATAKFEDLQAAGALQREIDKKVWQLQAQERRREKQEPKVTAAIQQAAQKREDAMDMLIKAMNADDAANDIFNQFGWRKPDGGKGGGDNALDIAKLIIRARRKLTEQIIADEQEGIDGQRALAEQRYAEELEDIEARKKANMELAKTEEERAQVIELANTEAAAATRRFRATMRDLREKELNDTIAENQKSLNAWKQYGEQIVQLENERREKISGADSRKDLSTDEKEQLKENINAIYDSRTKAAGEALLETLTKDLDAKLIVQEMHLEAVGKEMQEAFANSNVDLLARPMIDAAELVKKGWEDAGEGIATVFTQGFGIVDAKGAVRELLVTPILPDGTVLSPEELEGYLHDTLEGAEDILAADKLGIVIGVDVDESAGEALHQMQEEYYGLAASIDDTKHKIAELSAGVKAAMDIQLTDTLTLSLQELQSELASITPDIEKMKNAGALTPEQEQIMARYYALLTALGIKEAELGQIDKSTAKEAGKKWKSTMKVLSDVKNLVGDIGKAFGDSLSEGAKAALDTAQTVATSTITMISSIQAVAKTGEEAVKGVERASVILAAVSAAIQVVGAIIRFASDNLSKSAKAMKQLQESQQAVSRWEKIMAENELDNQQKTGGGGVDYWQLRVRDIKDYEHAVKLARQEFADAQKAEYEASMRYASWGTAGNKKKLDEAVDARLEANKKLKQAMVNEMQEWNELYSEFFGTTAENLAGNIADSIVDGFASGLDESDKIWDESVDDMMRTALKQQLARQLPDVFQSTFSRISEGGYLDDGEISASEAAEIRRSLDDAKERGQEYIDLARLISDTLGFDDDAEINPDRGGLAQASQDSIDLLTGIATSIQGFCLNMDSSLRGLAQSNADGLVVLRAIKDDTARLGAIEHSIHEIRENMADVQTRGLKLNMG